MNIYAVVGTGGFAREVMPIAISMLGTQKQNYKLVFVAEDTTLNEINGIPVLSESDFFSISGAEKYFSVAIGDSTLRKKISDRYIEKNISPFSIYASNSVVLSSNHIGEGAIFCPFTTVTSNARIGKFFHSNLYSYVAHDCVIGDYVTFAPGVKCNGGVIIEDNVYVGAGAVIKQGTVKRPIIIGKNSVVGMGAVVTKSVPPDTTVLGNPAKPLRAV
ncbi:acetyltransferase [Pseudomonas juntendi]